MKREKVYTVYKTTNKINGKYYIGVHKTSNPNDDYLGSGKVIRRAIEKYGIENFVKEILHIFHTPKEAFEMEHDLVTFELIESGQVYNLKEGGEGGFDLVNQITSPDTRRRAQSLGVENWKKNNSGNKEFSQKMKESYRKGLGQLTPEQRKLNSAKSFQGKQHSEETKKRIGSANSLRQQGSNNSNYGKTWVSKDGASKMVSKDELLTWVEQGWEKGRKSS